MAGLFTVQCVYFYKSNSDEIITPPQVEFAKEASQFQNTFWENHDLRAASNYLYLFGLCILFLLFFKQWFCNGSETELKGKIGIRENISLVFYHIKTVGA